MTGRETCEWCGGQVIPGTTCPKSIACPTCGVGPGQSCRRPSDHRAAQLHAKRISTAEARDAPAPVDASQLGMET